MSQQTVINQIVATGAKAGSVAGQNSNQLAGLLHCANTAEGVSCTKFRDCGLYVIAGADHFLRCKLQQWGADRPRTDGVRPDLMFCTDYGNGAGPGVCG